MSYANAGPSRQGVNLGGGGLPSGLQGFCIGNLEDKAQDRPRKRPGTGSRSLGSFGKLLCGTRDCLPAFACPPFGHQTAGIPVAEWIQ